MNVAEAIAAGDPEGLAACLAADSTAANASIVWGKNDKNLTAPLHFVSDLVFDGRLANGTEGRIAQVLIDHGADVNGPEGSESPLLGATSLGATRVANVLLNAGADIHRTSIFDATAVHWAAYMGTPDIVAALIGRGADIERRCEFKSTPLFWAVQGFSKYGPEDKRDQVEAAAVLARAGADLSTRNIEGVSALERSRESESSAMTELLAALGAS